MISVVIPCYNAASFISETLNSILEQQGVQIEVIVVDDGSTDTSATIIKSFGRKVQYIYQVNRGVSSARNKGLQISTGNYIVFFDADDKMSEDFLLSRKNVLDEDEDIGFTCGPVVNFPVNTEMQYGVAEDVAKKLLTYERNFSSCPSNYMIRKKVLAEHNIAFNERLSSTADRYFLVQLASVAKGKIIDKAPLLYRISDNSMSNRLSKKLVLDNEQYFIELKKNKLIPEPIHSEFLFYIQYILGIAFIKTGLYRKGIQYTLSCFIKTPGKFLKRVFIN
jgi:teichuronic acid biosynthesis glycosyltransferase TuaG